MKRTRGIGTGAALAAAVVVCLGACSDSPPPARVDAGRGAVSDAAAPRAAAPASRVLPFLEGAARSGKHAFVFVHRGEVRPADAPYTAFRTAMETAKDRADAMAVEVSDPGEAEFVRRYDLTRTPLPAVLVFAPNGALVRGLVDFDEQALLAAFATPSMADCMKSIAEKQTVVLCVQGAKTRSNEAAMRGARELESDPEYAGRVNLIVVDPAGEGEAVWLAGLGVPTNSEEAVTVLLSPPSTLTTLVGATTKAQLVEALQPPAPS